MEKKYLVGNIEIGGFGAMYARRKLIMQIAEAFGREPIFRFTNYVYEDPFTPLTTTLEDLKKQGINEVKKFNFQNTDDRVVFFDFDSYWGSINCDKYQCWFPENKTYLSYSGEIYDRLKINKQFTEEVQQSVNQIKQEWGVNNDFKNILGLHFRKGDKINESLYLSEDFVINFIKDKFDITKSRVFVTSDDKECILSIIKKYPEIDFIYDKEEKRYGKQDLSNMQLVINNPELKHNETLTFIKNIEILKQCLCVIGCYNVQLTKISGCINSFINNKNNLYLINPNNNQLEEMGNSLETS
jgi:hypothetical protein